MSSDEFEESSPVYCTRSLTACSKLDCSPGSQAPRIPQDLEPNSPAGKSCKDLPGACMTEVSQNYMQIPIDPIIVSEKEVCVYTSGLWLLSQGKA